ncbi:MAG: acyl transferase [Sphingobacteriaceae bacterium]|nr:acyl transferase [Sphingobacteriaceae bacterium]
MFTDITDVFKINCDEDFKKVALKVFRYQYQNNPVYRSWTAGFVRSESDVTEIEQIPFLPIEFFKTQDVICEGTEHQEVFTSSSTTSQVPSKHIVKDLSIYERSFTNGFELFFGKPKDYCILALLPGYLERTGSSLVYMCKKLIELTDHKQSGFYLRDLDELIDVIKQLKIAKQKTFIIGVSYALLDLAEKNIELNSDFTIIETGGMKGTRKEMPKEELHSELKRKFKLGHIASEYGMTELLSQAYAKQDGQFKNPPWLKFMIRDVNDPLTYLAPNKTGGINVIDLANVYSCSFIATQDLGQINEIGELKLIGQYDNNDIRDCNLMLS